MTNQIKFITFGTHENFTKLPRENTINSNTLAKQLNNTALNCIMYNAYNKPSLQWAIFALDYYSGKVNNAMMCCLNNGVKVRILTPMETITLIPNGTNLENYNFLKNQIVNQAKRWAAEQETQEAMNHQHQLYFKAKQLFAQPESYTKIYNMLAVISETMQSLGYEEDKIPDVIIPNIKRKASIINFINNYAGLYDIETRTQQEERESTIEFFNQYGGFNEDYIVKDTTYKKSMGRRYQEMYERTPQLITPDYETFYQLTYYMVNEIVPDIQPPFEHYNTVEEDYQYYTAKR